MGSLGAALGLQISCLELRTSGGRYGLRVEGELRGEAGGTQQGERGFAVQAAVSLVALFSPGWRSLQTQDPSPQRCSCFQHASNLCCSCPGSWEDCPVCLPAALQEQCWGRFAWCQWCSASGRSPNCTAASQRGCGEGRLFNQLACQHEGAPLTLQDLRTKATLVARSDFLPTCVQHGAKSPRALSNFACTSLEKASSSLP